MVQLAKAAEEHRHHCGAHPSDTCPTLEESFDNFGSWMASFGIGALGITLVFLGAVALRHHCRTGRRLPLHWATLRTAGVAAGMCWSVGNFLITAAVVMHGNAVVMAQVGSAMLITSGLLGIFYYGEVGTAAVRAVWCASAVWTLAAMVLLGPGAGRPGVCG